VEIEKKNKKERNSMKISVIEYIRLTHREAVSRGMRLKAQKQKREER